MSIVVINLSPQPGADQTHRAKMSAEECLEQMKRHHTHYNTERTCDNDHHTDVSDSIDNTAVNLFSGAEVASRFAKSAATQLQDHELSALTAFFRKTHHHAKPNVKQLLRENLQEFYQAEMLLSGQDQSRLTAPSGAEDAKLGLILHIQSRDGCVPPFWDPSSATIQMLEGKGLNDQMLFGYDWHWRAESLNDRHDPNCSTRWWSKPLRQLHDEFSMDVLRMLPLPFVVIFGSCPQKSFRRLSGHKLKLVEVTLMPPDGKLQFLLDFNSRDGSLSRIYCLLNHPAAIFYAKASLLRTISLCLDSGLNFILWLLGSQHEPTYFFRKATLCHYTRWQPFGLERGLKGAPLAELHAYRRQERREERRLTVHDYSATFLAWTRNYLGQDPAELLDQEVSIVSAIQEKINQKLRDKIHQRTALKKAAQSTSTSTASTATSSNSTQPDREIQKLSCPSFTPEEIAWAAGWLSNLDVGTSEDVDEASPFVHLTPHELLALQYELAIAEALHIRRLLNIDPSWDKARTEKRIHALKNNLRVKEFSIRKSYGVSLRPRPAGSKKDVNPGQVHEGINTKQNHAENEQQDIPIESRRTRERNPNEIRRRLVEGATFDCRNGKIVIHCGLFVYIPRDASPTGILVKCHLLPEGDRHGNPFATDALLQDPAIRLGVEVKCRSNLDGLMKT